MAVISIHLEAVITSLSFTELFVIFFRWGDFFSLEKIRRRKQFYFFLLLIFTFLFPTFVLLNDVILYWLKKLQLFDVLDWPRVLLLIRKITVWNVSATQIEILQKCDRWKSTVSTAKRLTVDADWWCLWELVQFDFESLHYKKARKNFWLDIFCERWNTKDGSEISSPFKRR